MARGTSSATKFTKDSRTPDGVDSEHAAPMHGPHSTAAACLKLELAPPSTPSSGDLFHRRACVLGGGKESTGCARWSFRGRHAISSRRHQATAPSHHGPVPSNHPNTPVVPCSFQLVLAIVRCPSLPLLLNKSKNCPFPQGTCDGTRRLRSVKSCTTTRDNRIHTPRGRVCVYVFFFSFLGAN